MGNGGVLRCVVMLCSAHTCEGCVMARDERTKGSFSALPTHTYLPHSSSLHSPTLPRTDLLHAVVHVCKYCTILRNQLAYVPTLHQGTIPCRADPCRSDVMGSRRSASSGEGVLSFLSLLVAVSGDLSELSLCLVRDGDEKNLLPLSAVGYSCGFSSDS